MNVFERAVVTAEKLVRRVAYNGLRGWVAAAPNTLLAPAHDGTKVSAKKQSAGVNESSEQEVHDVMQPLPGESTFDK